METGDVAVGFTFTQGSNNAAKVRGSFQETSPRMTAEHTVKHRDGGAGSVVANHRGDGESSVVVTTLHSAHKIITNTQWKLKTSMHPCNFICPEKLATSKAHEY